MILNPPLTEPKEPKEPRILTVSAGSPVFKVSEVITRLIVEGSPFYVRAVGAGAVNQMVKAIAKTTMLMEKMGRPVCWTPRFVTLQDTQKAEGGELSAILMELAHPATKIKS